MPKGVVVLGFDAAGGELALTAVKEAIEQAGHPVRIDELSGTADYPDVAESTCRAVVEPDVHSGILVCGTGIGMSIAANKMPGILAARCGDVYSVEKARRNAGANVLTFGSELTTPAIASALVGTWLAHEFDSERSIPKVARVRALDAAQSGGMSDVAWVIGHGGIGSAVARRLGSDHRVTTFDRRAEADVPVDLSDAAATVDALRRAPAPAVVVVAAGTVSPVEPGGDPDDIGRVIDDNLAALVTVLGVLGELPPLRCAVIVSNAALVARPGQPVYAATKAAAVSLIRSTALAWGPRGSRIYGLAPGTVVVPRNADALAARFPELPLATDRPGGRVALPDDLAGFVAATLPFADFLTGHSLPFDAGSSLG